MRYLFFLLFYSMALCHFLFGYITIVNNTDYYVGVENIQTIRISYEHPEEPKEYITPKIAPWDHLQYDRFEGFDRLVGMEGHDGARVVLWGDKGVQAGADISTITPGTPKEIKLGVFLKYFNNNKFCVTVSDGPYQSTESLPYQQNTVITINQRPCN